MSVTFPTETAVPGIRKNGEYCNGVCEDCDCRQREDDSPEVETEW